MSKTRRSSRGLHAHAALVAGSVGAAFLLTLSPVWAATPAPTQTVPALLAKIKPLGQPIARVTVGTQIQVRGMVLNTDTKQHDAYLSATLLDAQRHVVGHAMGKAEDLKPGHTGSYTLTGTILASHWVAVRIKVTRVTENVGGAGTD